MANPLTKLDFLTDLKTHIHKHNKVVAEVFKPLDDEQLNWRSNRKEWNILQCFDHLNLTHEYYAPKIAGALSEPKPTISSQDLYKPSFWGWIYMNFAFNPKYSFPTIKEITPQAGASHEVLDVYLTKQVTLVNILEQVGEIDLRRTPVPLEKGIKFNLGDCLKVLVYHDNLHFEQAKGIIVAMRS